MRVRAAALIALFVIALIPGTSGAAQPMSAPSLRVSVKPAFGSRTTKFRISFKACPAILPLPQIVGKFTLRVKRG